MNETPNKIDYLREQRNINPHAEAIMAISIWGYQYSRQNLGCMDWWDALPESKKKIVRSTLDRIATLPRENAHHSHPGLERERE